MPRCGVRAITMGGPGASAPRLRSWRCDLPAGHYPATPHATIGGKRTWVSGEETSAPWVEQWPDLTAAALARLALTVTVDVED